MAARAGGALASRAGPLCRQLKGLHARLRAFSTWPQIFCLTAFLLPLAARRAMMLILRRQASTSRSASKQRSCTSAIGGQVLYRSYFLNSETPPRLGANIRAATTVPLRKLVFLRQQSSAAAASRLYVVKP